MPTPCGMAPTLGYPGCQHLHHARPVTLRCRSVQKMTRNGLEYDGLLLLRSHQRRALSRTVRGQGIQNAMDNVGESNDLPRVHSHRIRSLAIAVQLRRVHIVTPSVME